MAQRAGVRGVAGVAGVECVAGVAGCVRAGLSQAWVRRVPPDKAPGNPLHQACRVTLARVALCSPQ